MLVLIDLGHRRDRTLPGSTLSFATGSSASSAVARGIRPGPRVLPVLCACYVFGWRTQLESRADANLRVPMAHVGVIEHVLTPNSAGVAGVTNLTWPDSLCPVWSYPALQARASLQPDVVAGMVVVVVLLALIFVLWVRRETRARWRPGSCSRWLSRCNWFPWCVVLRGAMAVSADPLHLVTLSWLLRRWGRLATLAGVAGALVLMPQAWPYAATFADNLRMAHEIIVRQPDNYQGRKCYAVALFRNHQYPEAIQAANQMLERFGETGTPTPCSFEATW